MRALSYIATLVVLFSVFFAARFYFQISRPATLTQEAIRPSIHLVNSKLYFEEDNYKRSLKELERGIEEIEGLKTAIHPASEEKINEALAELQRVYENALDKDISKDQINQASVDMLLALTYSQVKAAKAFIEEQKQKKCRQALRYAMYHIKNALILSEGTKKDYEVQIYAEMNEVVKNYRLTADDITDLIGRILADLEASEVVFS